MLGHFGFSYIGLLYMLTLEIPTIFYVGYWIRYFTGGRTLRDFYRPFLGVPVPGAALPVAAFLLLGIYGKVIWLIASSVALGVGHVGIHAGHVRKINN